MTNYILCSDCFNNEGLKITAQKIGIKNDEICINCHSNKGLKLDKDKITDLMYRYFSHGSVPENIGGYAPVYKITDSKGMKTVVFDKTLQYDYNLLKSKTELIVFLYGAPVWRFGLTTQYNMLNGGKDEEIKKVLNEILSASSKIVLPIGTKLYRIRTELEDTYDYNMYDTPPKNKKKCFDRFDDEKIDVFYSALDIETCLHETRVTIADEITLATFLTTKEIKILNIADSFNEKKGVTPFEDIGILMHKLCTTNEREYGKCRLISGCIKNNGYEGFKYLSYYTKVKDKPLHNVALFGFPLKENKIKLQSLNRIKLEKVNYEYSFGPVEFPRKLNCELWKRTNDILSQKMNPEEKMQLISDTLDTIRYKNY